MEIENYSPFEDFPAEVLEQILLFCGGYLYRASQVCSGWRQFALLQGNVKEKFINLCIEEDRPCIAKFLNSCFHFANLRPLVENENIEMLERVCHLSAASLSIQYFAADVGSLKVIKWYARKFPECQLYPAGKDAARKGHWDIVEFLIGQTPLWYSGLMEGAAESGNLEMLIQLQERGFVAGKEVCRLAASKGHLEILRWLRSDSQKLCPWDQYAPYSAAEGGHLEVLEWLKEQGCPWSGEVSTTLALHGHFEALKWEIETGGEWCSSIAHCIAAKGNLEVLQWTLENGCPYGQSATEGAAAEGHLFVLKWLLGKGISPTEKCVDLALQSGSVETVRWLRSQGLPWPEEFDPIRLNEPSEEIRNWAIRNGCPREYFYDLDTEGLD